LSGKASIMEYEHNFELLIQKLEDEQLIEILKKRKLYQYEAANAAIQEAIKRDIIASEEDLHLHEFSHEPLKPRLFPLIENPKNRNRLRKSIARGLLLTGLLPLIWGMVRFNAGLKTEGMLLFTFGIVWMGLSAWLIRMYSSTAVRLLIILAGFSILYVIRRMILSPQIIFMDMFITGVLYSFVLYGMLFVQRLKD
jgi:hypothetical protein